MRIFTTPFGTTATGERLMRYTMENKNGVKVSVINGGCAVTELWVPDRNGKHVDIVPGSGAVYEQSEHPVFRGRVSSDALHLRYDDPRSGAAVRVTYALDDNNVLTMKYWAESAKDTILRLTAPCYFDLDGGDSGAVEHQLLQIAADTFCETADDGCPTSVTRPVAGTSMDFRTLRHIGRDAYAHHFFLRPNAAPAAFAYAPSTGIALSIVTTQLGLQLYTAAGFCLATQPRTMVLIAGEAYEETTLLQLQTLETL